MGFEVSLHQIHHPILESEDKNAMKMKMSVFGPDLESDGTHITVTLSKTISVVEPLARTIAAGHRRHNLDRTRMISRVPATKWGGGLQSRCPFEHLVV